MSLDSRSCRPLGTIRVVPVPFKGKLSKHFRRHALVSDMPAPAPSAAPAAKPLSAAKENSKPTSLSPPTLTIANRPGPDGTPHIVLEVHLVRLVRLELHAASSANGFGRLQQITLLSSWMRSGCTLTLGESTIGAVGYRATLTARKRRPSLLRASACCACRRRQSAHKERRKVMCII